MNLEEKTALKSDFNEGEFFFETTIFRKDVNIRIACVLHSLHRWWKKNLTEST